MDATLLDKIAADQAGLFTRAQARACGYSSYQIRRRVRTGEWHQIFGSVLSRAGVAVTPWVRDRAVYLAIGGSVLAGPSAARIWGIDVPDRRTCVAVPPDRHLHSVDVVALRVPVDDEDVVGVDGVLTTSRARAVFDCLRLLPDEAALDLLDRAIRTRWVTVDDLAARVRAFVGRRGAPRLVLLVQAAASGAQSHAERRAVALLRRAGLPGWRANDEIHDQEGLIGLGDIVFRAAKLVVEIDGFAFHRGRDSFQRDRERQNRLILAGWTVLRFTWRDLVERPDQVIATIRSTLARLGHQSR